MELVSDYMRDDTLRHALNDLTRKTFGFDFEDWVTGGYFEGDYIPYSFIENGKIISNVSANRMTFIQQIWKMYIMQRIWIVSLLQKWKKILCFYRASYVKIM